MRIEGQTGWQESSVRALAGGSNAILTSQVFSRVKIGVAVHAEKRHDHAAAPWLILVRRVLRALSAQLRALREWMDARRARRRLLRDLEAIFGAR
jgi:hypothetical protein